MTIYECMFNSISNLIIVIVFYCRDKEAADQVNLMRQLENALRTQQQLTTAKSEVFLKKFQVNTHQ